MRQLLIFMAMAAVIVACLFDASTFVGDLFYTLGLLTIAFATIATICFRELRRAFWLGFVICFTGYFVHTVWPSDVRNTFITARLLGQMDSPAPQIITTRFLTTLYQGTLEAIAGPPTASRNMIPNRPMPNPQMARYMAFMTVGHCIFATLLGMGGGVVARRIAAHTLNHNKPSLYNFGS